MPSSHAQSFVPHCSPHVVWCTPRFKEVPMQVLHTTLCSLALAFITGCGGSSPAPATPADEAPAQASNANETTGSESASEATTSANNPKSTSSPTKPDQPSKPAAPADPYADMPHPAPSDSGRLELIGTDVSPVVAAYRPHLRTLCWTPRVNEDASSSVDVRVAMQIEVNPDGTVKSVKASGAKDYPGLAQCVEDHARRWHFPTAQRTSTLMFPVTFTREEVQIIRVN